jgi:signal transduction histidine kinase
MPSSLPAELDRLLHDLRGPLNSAVMHVEVLRRAAAADPAAKQSVDTIADQLQRLAAMLPAVFDVVALEIGPTRVVSLRDIAAGARAETGAADAVLADAPWPEVVGDPRLLTLAAAHLLRNAVAATLAAGGPRPAPRLEADILGDGRAALRVRDWGVGLKSTNPKVLVRLAVTAGPLSPRGHGIGLLASERIARLHGGGLSFRQLVDGAEVSLVLPAAG